MARHKIQKFPMNGKTVSCAQCGKTVSKKKTHATEIKYGKAFNQSKEQSFRKSKPTDTTAGRKREGSPIVTFVKRVCRNGCN